MGKFKSKWLKFIQLNRYRKILKKLLLMLPMIYKMERRLYR
ncbi:MAG TPA: hypothetical protein VKO43_08480 [Candidatus Krumholzibacteriaceae bacterium]|nr:hypothetical protein [Candidatus Krumholzibacteriaceae bacterium]